MVERRGDGYQKVIEFRKLQRGDPVSSAQASGHERSASRDREAVRHRPALPSASGGRQQLHRHARVHERLDLVQGRARVDAGLEGSRRWALRLRQRRLRPRDARAAVSLADVRCVTAAGAARGQGTLDFRLRWRGDTATYIAQNADVRIDSTHAAGDFAISLARRQPVVPRHRRAILAASTRTSSSSCSRTVKVPRHGTLTRQREARRTTGTHAGGRRRRVRRRALRAEPSAWRWAPGHDGRRRSLPRSRRHARSGAGGHGARVRRQRFPLGGIAARLGATQRRDRQPDRRARGPHA